MYGKLLAILWVAGIASASNGLAPDGKQGVAATIVSSTPNILKTAHVPVTPTSVGAPIVIAYSPAVATVTSTPPISTVTAAPIVTKTVRAPYTAPDTKSIVLPESKTYSPPIVADPVVTKFAPSFSYQLFTTHSVSGPVVAQRLNAPTVIYNHATDSPSLTRAYLSPVTQDNKIPHVTVYVVEPARVKSVAPAYSYQNFYQVIPAKKTVVAPIVAAKTVSAPLVSTYAAPVVSAPVAAAKTVTTYTAPATPTRLTANTIEAPEATYAAGPGVATYSASAPAPVQYVSTVPVRYAAAAPVQYASYAVSAPALEAPVVTSYTADPADSYTADPATCITAPGITYAAPLSGASYVSDSGVPYSAGHTSLSYSAIPGVTYSVIPAGYNTAPAVSAYGVETPELTHANVPWTFNAAAPAYGYVNYGAEYPFKK